MKDWYENYMDLRRDTIRQNSNEVRFHEEDRGIIESDDACSRCPHQLHWEDSEAEVDYEETAKNLFKIGYQKIIWHDVRKELPKCNTYVLSYCTYDNTFAVVKWHCAGWSDDNEICYNVDYWAELPKPPEINIED